MRILTERLILRKSDRSDAAKLFSVLNNDAVKEYVFSLYCHYYTDAYFLVADTYNTTTSIFIIIEDRYSSDIVGVIYAYSASKNCPLNMLAAIKPEERGKGLMVEALKAFIMYLYEIGSSRTLKFVVHDSNISSLKVLEKLNIKPYYTNKNYSHFCLSLEEKPPF